MTNIHTESHDYTWTISVATEQTLLTEEDYKKWEKAPETHFKSNCYLQQLTEILSETRLIKS